MDFDPGEGAAAPRARLRELIAEEIPAGDPGAFTDDPADLETDHGVRVAIELAALQAEGWAERGVGRYAANYAAALDRAGVLTAALLDPARPPAAGLPPNLLFSGRVDWDDPSACRRLAAPGVWHHLTAPFLGFEADADVAGPGPWERAGVRRATILYDLLPLRAPRHYLAAPDIEARYRKRARWVAASEAILAISEHTRREAIEILGCDPQRVTTVGVGVSDFFSEADGTDDGRWKPVVKTIGDRPFLMTVTGSDARKGGDRAVTALGRLVERGYDLSLLVVGHLTDDWIGRMAEAARAAGVSGRVHLLGAVEDDLLRAAYRRAEVNLMPSLAEGAGLPVLESAACGTPALASIGTALGETAGVSLATFDPTDVDSIADAVAGVLDSPGRRAMILAVQQEAARRATWDSVAVRAVSALATASGRLQRTEPAALPRRLALVGRHRSGDRLAECRARARAEVDEFEDPLGAPLADYDAVVYLLGEDDDSVRGLAATHAGWLWPDPDGPGALEPLARHSRGIVVGTAADWEAVRLRLDPLAASPPVVVLVPGGDPLERLTADPSR